MAPGRGVRIPAMITCCRLARRVLVRAGTELTIVTWGAMVERCEQAAARSQRRRRAARPAHALALGQGGGAGLRAQDPPLSDRARGQC